MQARTTVNSQDSLYNERKQVCMKPYEKLMAFLSTRKYIFFICRILFEYLMKFKEFRKLKISNNDKFVLLCDRSFFCLCGIKWFDLSMNMSGVDEKLCLGEPFDYFVHIPHDWWDFEMLTWKKMRRLMLLIQRRI